MQNPKWTMQLQLKIIIRKHVISACWTTAASPTQRMQIANNMFESIAHFIDWQINSVYSPNWPRKKCSRFCICLLLNGATLNASQLNNASVLNNLQISEAYATLLAIDLKYVIDDLQDIESYQRDRLICWRRFCIWILIFTQLKISIAKLKLNYSIHELLNSVQRWPPNELSHILSHDSQSE